MLKVIEQAARCGDQNFDASAHGRFLLLDIHATEHDGRANAGVFGVGLDSLFDLDRKFTRWREHQRADRVTSGRRRAVRVLENSVQNRQREGCGFAGAGLGTAHHVEPGQNDWDCLRLNRRRLGVAGVGDGAQNGRGEI